jgi:ADP-ribose pyrophosphatase YjhB (NUDIX family)
MTPIVAGVGQLSGWRYCPRCVSELTGDDARRECPACGFVAYASSAPTASALVVDNGRVLFSRRRYEPFAGHWDLPGGFLQEGEHPLDALQRELAEETGLAVEPERFLGVWIDDYGDGDDARKTLNLYWTARVTAGEPQPADDVTELRWFAPDEVPADELAFNHIPAVISARRQQDA